MLSSLFTNNAQVEDYLVFSDSIQYLDWLAKGYEFEQKIVTSDVADSYRGNFFGLLNHLDISPSQYFFVMHINGIKNPYDFNGQEVILKIPPKPRIPKN